MCQGNHDQPYVSLPIFDFDVSPLIQSLAIMKSRVILKGNQPVSQSLIQWENGSVEDATEKITQCWLKLIFTSTLRTRLISMVGELYGKGMQRTMRDERVGLEGIIKEGHVAGVTKSMMGGKGA